MDAFSDEVYAIRAHIQQAFPATAWGRLHHHLDAVLLRRKFERAQSLLDQARAARRDGDDETAAARVLSVLDLYGGPPHAAAAGLTVEAHDLLKEARALYEQLVGAPFARSAAESAEQVSGTALSDFNILIIVLDSLRADHLGAYGYSKPTSPFIDRLAAEGIVFDRAQSNSSYTMESVASLFSGRFPSTHPWGAGWHARPDPGQPTLAEHFQSAGYATALFSNTPAINYPGFFRGFDEVACHAEFGHSGLAPRLVERALRFTRDHRDARRFLYLHFMDPHSPYDPPEDYYERFADPSLPPEQRLRLYEDVRPNLPELVAEGFGPDEIRFEDMRNRYDAEIAFVDAHLRLLFEGLRKLDSLDDTLVVFTSDHGEEFLEHGFVEHAWQLYWESLHVPLIFWAPAVFEPRRIDARVSLVDVMPSLLAFADLLPEANAYDGVPLFEAADGDWHFVPHTNPIIAELVVQSRVMVRMMQYDEHAYLAAQRWLSVEEMTEAWRLEFKIRRGFATGELTPMDIFGPVVYEALYDTRADQGQHHNLMANGASPLVERYRALLQAYMQRCPPPLSDRDRVLAEMEYMPPEQVNQMKTLGYVDGASDEPFELDHTLEEQLRTLGYL